MKIVCLLLSILFFTQCKSQGIAGTWAGPLKFPGGQLTIVLHLTLTDNGYAATADSPDQGVKGMKVDAVTFRNDSLQFSIYSIGASYAGKLEKDIFKGTFKQGENSIPLDLSKNYQQAEKKRPQEPVQPYPYRTEEVTFRNDKANITLAGTLTLPQQPGTYPAVVLISGSGAQNRDEAIMGHKPFLVLADHLTKNGIAVLRIDDRGVGKSGGVFAGATSADFATDVAAAFNYLQSRNEINKKQTGLMGHSEGGMIAPMVAAGNSNVAFIVLLAGPGVPGDQVLLLQNYSIGKMAGMTEAQLAVAKTTNKGMYDIIKAESNPDALKAKLVAYADKELTPQLIAQNIPEAQRNGYKQNFVKEMTSPWMNYFIRFDPQPVLKKVKCPVLALNGEKDIQVAAVENLAGIQKALKEGGNKKVTIQQLPGLNHLFQECTTGATSEYSQIEQTFSPVALNVISQWITGIVSK